MLWEARKDGTSYSHIIERLLPARHRQDNQPSVRNRYIALGRETKQRAKRVKQAEPLEPEASDASWEASEASEVTSGPSRKRGHDLSEQTATAKNPGSETTLLPESASAHSCVDAESIEAVKSNIESLANGWKLRGHLGEAMHGVIVLTRITTRTLVAQLS